MFRMHPIFDKSFSRKSFGLCDLVFVMREYVIDSSTMDINGWSKDFYSHRRAFEMPARPTWTPRTLPKNGAIAFAIIFFPKGKVGDMIFAIFVVGYPLRCTGL